MESNRLIVFTKPWKALPLGELADLVARMGFHGVELPVRDAYQVNPDNVESALVNAQKIFKNRGLLIASVAGSIDEKTIRAMGDAGISVLRVCISIDMRAGYFASVQSAVDKINSVKRVLESSHVKVGLQNHHGTMVGSALGLQQMMEKLDPAIAGSVLDFAHCSLDGEPVEMALDIVKDSLCLVNFKSAYRARVNSPDEPTAEWKVVWTTGRHGGYSWGKAIKELRKMKYKGDICFPAEYNRIGWTNQLMGEEAISKTELDIAYFRELLTRD